MKRTLLFALLLFSITYGNAQVISNIDFDQIEKETKDSTSGFYYPTLTKRLLKHDTTLTLEEYKYLYYGNVFTEAYNPYGTSDLEKKFIDLYNKEKYKKAIKIGEKVLNQNPINLKITFKMLVCYHVQEIKDSSKVYADMYYKMLGTIYRSGDGQSIATAYVVLKVDDEYQMVADLRLETKSQSLLDGPTDLLKFNVKKQKGRENKIKELHFNVRKPFEHLAKSFKKSK